MNFSFIGWLLCFPDDSASTSRVIQRLAVGVVVA